MLTPTPGVRFLAKALISLLTPVAFVALIVSPTWFPILSSFFIFPLFVFIKINLREISHRRKAAALGARLCPRAEGKWPGNADTTYNMMQSWKYGYPGGCSSTFTTCIVAAHSQYLAGDTFTDVIIKTHGPVVDMHVFWEPLIFTTCPEHLQIMLATDFQNYVKGVFLHNFL
jgi:hypothetical protein